jgi:hypothetical protein
MRERAFGRRPSDRDQGQDVPRQRKDDPRDEQENAGPPVARIASGGSDDQAVKGLHELSPGKVAKVARPPAGVPDLLDVVVHASSPGADLTHHEEHPDDLECGSGRHEDDREAPGAHVSGSLRAGGRRLHHPRSSIPRTRSASSIEESTASK